LKLFPFSETIKTPSEDGMANTLSPGSTFKNSRTSLSKTTRYRSSTLNTAITHPTLLTFLPRLNLSYPLNYYHNNMLEPTPIVALFDRLMECVDHLLPLRLAQVAGATHHLSVIVRLQAQVLATALVMFKKGERRR